MTACLRLAEPAPQPLHDRIRALLEPRLAGLSLALRCEDPVGGGPGCAVGDCPRPVQTTGRCERHHQRWLRAAVRPDQAWDPGPPLTSPTLSLRSLPEMLRLEVAYGVQRASQLGAPTLTFHSLAALVVRLRQTEISSLLDPDERLWPRPGGGPPGRLSSRFLMFTIDELDALAGRGGREAEFARDQWRLRRLGYPELAAWVFTFTAIPQPWLRTAVKRFLRWRMDTGHSHSGMHRDLQTLTRLARALTDVAGQQARVEDFTRYVIERLLTLLAEEGLSANGRSIALCSVTAFLTAARQHDWMPNLPSTVGIYSGDIPRRTPLPPRALPEVVMAQLEDPANLAKLTEPGWRLLITLLIQTGLRINDALRLERDCLVRDHQQAPYLRYFNHKMRREALVPINAELSDAVTGRAIEVGQRHPQGRCLFPRARSNPHGDHPVGATMARRVLDKWLTDCDVRDEHHQQAQITFHQFRHTLGTRLINNDVPQEVVRRILDHTSLDMTAHYARLHDTTVREHWERARKVNIHGEPVELAQNNTLGDAAWVKHHLGRASMALPNGHCGLPLQQSCPHANACLTCPVFITTPEFLDQHREQLAATQAIIARAQDRGQLRLIEINQRIATNLTNIITGLEPDPGAAHPEARDAG